jgi:ankyrin repeat protein
MYGLVGKAEELVASGKFTVNSPDKDGNFPLHWASNGDHLDVMKVGATSLLHMPCFPAVLRCP